MSQFVEMTGKTVDEAIDAALIELGIEREQAQIEILETPRCESSCFSQLRTRNGC